MTLQKEKKENYLREAVFIFFAQKKVILRTTATLFLISVLIAFFWPPTYSATGSILVRGKKMEKSAEALEKEDARTMPVTMADLASEAEVLTSPAMIDRTINFLKSNGLYQGTPKAASRDAEIHLIKEFGIKTVISPTSNVIEISYFDKNKDYAIIFLQTLMDQYTEHRMELYSPEKTETFFTGQAGKFQDELTEKERELIDMVAKSRTADPVKQIEMDLDIRSDLEKALDKLRAEAVDKKLFVDQLEKDLHARDKSFFSYIENEIINTMSSNLQDLLIERGRILRVYTKESEKIQHIDQQIKDGYAALQTEVRSYTDNERKKLEIVTTKIQMLEERINNIIAADVDLKKNAIEQQSLNREINLRQSSYETFAKRREEAKTATDKNVPSFVSVVNRAFPSNGPVFPKKRLVIPLGILAGFLTGFSLGFMRHYFDHTFKKPTDVEIFGELDVIFSIPFEESFMPASPKPAVRLMSIVSPIALFGQAQDPQTLKKKYLAASKNSSHVSIGLASKMGRRVGLFRRLFW